MRKSGIAGILGIMAIVMGMVVFLSVTRPRNTAQPSSIRELEEILALDLKNEYPNTPDGVLTIYNKIDKYLSGNFQPDLSDENLLAIVEKQRTLLDRELLDINPIEEQVKGTKEKMEYVTEENMRIIQIVQETPRFNSDATRCDVNANQYWSMKNRINGTSKMIYYLLKEENEGETEGKWRIVGWEVTDIVPVGGTDGQTDDSDQGQ